MSITPGRYFFFWIAKKGQRIHTRTQNARLYPGIFHMKLMTWFCLYLCVCVYISNGGEICETWNVGVQIYPWLTKGSIYITLRNLNPVKNDWDLAKNLSMTLKCPHLHISHAQNGNYFIFLLPLQLHRFHLENQDLHTISESGDTSQRSL